MKKELTPLEKEIKQEKNKLANNLNNIIGVSSPRALANHLFNNEIAKGIYKRSFKDIVDMLALNNINIDENDLVLNLSTTHQIVLKKSLLYLNEYVQSKAGIDFRKVKEGIFGCCYDISYDAHIYLRKQIKENSGKDITPYEDLKRTIINNYNFKYEEEKEEIKKAKEEELKEKEFYKAQKSFLDHEHSMYHDVDMSDEELHDVLTDDNDEDIPMHR